MDVMGRDERTVVIVVVRDPRDVVRSLHGVPWSRPGVVRVALRWLRYCRLTEELRSRYAERTLVVRFEDLVIDPDLVLADVWTFLGGRPGGEAAPAVVPRTFDPSREPWKAKATALPDPVRAHAWMASPNPSDLVIEGLCSHVLAHYSYEPHRLSWIARPVARSLGALRTMLVAGRRFRPSSPR